MDTFLVLLKDLEASGLALAMRKSVWLFPIVNTAHIFGLALLVGSVCALDLRLIGAWKSVPVVQLSRVTVPLAGSGLCLTLVTGSLLFLTRASRYAQNPFFQFKMALILLAIANLALLHRSRAWKRLRDGGDANGSLGLVWGGLISLVAWSGALIAGRMIAYW